MSGWTADTWIAIGAVLLSGGALGVGVLGWRRQGETARRAEVKIDEANEIAREAKAETVRIAAEMKTIAEKANDLAATANRVAKQALAEAGASKRVAEAANDLAESANAISADSKGIAEGANTLAAQANDLATGANTLSGEANDIARQALDVSRESAISARESALAAAATADHERAGLQFQRDVHHEHLRPQLPPRLMVKPKKDTAGRAFLVVEIEVNGDYRVAADAVLENGTAPASVPALLHKGRKEEVFVEHLAPGQHEPKVKSIRFRFWPPTEYDGVDQWRCGCGAREVADGGEGHWTREVLVYRRPPVVVSTASFGRPPRRG